MFCAHKKRIWNVKSDFFSSEKHTNKQKVKCIGESSQKHAVIHHWNFSQLKKPRKKRKEGKWPKMKHKTSSELNWKREDGYKKRKYIGELILRFCENAFCSSPLLSPEMYLWCITRALVWIPSETGRHHELTWFSISSRFNARWRHHKNNFQPCSPCETKIYEK